MRPPSRHKDLPQGLDLPPNEQDDDVPSLDEDSDSLEEFEIGIQNARSANRGGHKKQMSSFDKNDCKSKTFQVNVPLSGAHT